MTPLNFVDAGQFQSSSEKLLKVVLQIQDGFLLTLCCDTSEECVIASCAREQRKFGRIWVLISRQKFKIQFLRIAVGHLHKKALFSELVFDLLCYDNDSFARELCSFLPKDVEAILLQSLVSSFHSLRPLSLESSERYYFSDLSTFYHHLSLCALATASCVFSAGSTNTNHSVLIFLWRSLPP